MGRLGQVRGWTIAARLFFFTAGLSARRRTVFCSLLCSLPQKPIMSVTSPMMERFLLLCSCLGAALAVAIDDTSLVTRQTDGAISSTYFLRRGYHACKSTAQRPKYFIWHAITRGLC